MEQSTNTQSIVQVPGCILIAVVNTVVSWTMEAEFQVDPRALVIVMLVFTLPAMIFAWFSPRLIVRLDLHQFLPKSIFPDARSLVSLSATTLAGFVLSELVLSLLIGGWHVAMLAGFAPSLLVFLVSAKRMEGHSDEADPGR